MQRWVDGGFIRLAELAAESTDEGSAGGPLPEQSRWHITALSVPITFDLAIPEVFETRRVRADQDEVREIELGMTFTPPVG